MCFTKQMLNHVAIHRIKCKACTKKKKGTNEDGQFPCDKCGKFLDRIHFSDGQWRGNHKTHVCRNCTSSPKALQNRGQWTCRAYGCNLKGDKELFQLWRSRQKKDKANGYEKCNACFKQLDADAQSRALHAKNLEKHSRDVWRCRRAHQSLFLQDEQSPRGQSRTVHP